MTDLRTLVRRAVRPLPARTQIAIRELRNRVTGAHDAAIAVRALRVREQAWLDETVRVHAGTPGRQRMLVCVLQQTPPWLETSYALATALRLRGHEVSGVLCDGVLPICEMNLGGQERPPCDVCVGWLERHEEAFGFEFARLSEYAEPDDREQARSIVDGAAAASAPLVVDGLDLRRLARRELQRYRRGFSFEPESDPAYRDWLAAAVLARRLADRLFARERPDVLVISSGRTLLSACIVAAARGCGVRVVMWDTEPAFPDGLVFSHAQPAVEIPLDEAWERVKADPLSDAAREALMSFLGRWARSDGTPFPYNPAPIDDEAAIRTSLALRVDARLISAFANSAWDMAAVDRDRGFAHMFEWLFTLVDYAREHPGVDVAIRAHPAEVKVPEDLRSRTPVVDVIRQRCGDLPRNLALIDGHSAISSYGLAAMSDVVTVYSSRFGLELAVSGRRPWIAGDVTYRGKGFSRDLTSKDDLVAALDAGERSAALSDDERELAVRFACLWMFRYVTRVPLLRPADGRFALESFHDLAPGATPVLDRICSAIESAAPFLDLGGI